MPNLSESVPNLSELVRPYRLAAEMLVKAVQEGTPANELIEEITFRSNPENCDIMYDTNNGSRVMVIGNPKCTFTDIGTQERCDISTATALAMAIALGVVEQLLHNHDQVACSDLGLEL